MSTCELDHLVGEQKEVVRRMLYEQSFARDGNDIGYNSSLQIVISLKDDIPVQRVYTSKAASKVCQRVHPRPYCYRIDSQVQVLLCCFLGVCA